MQRKHLLFNEFHLQEPGYIDDESGRDCWHNVVEGPGTSRISFSCTPIQMFLSLSIIKSSLLFTDPGSMVESV